MRLEAKRVACRDVAVCLAAFLLGVSAFAAEQEAAALAARTRKGVLALQVGSDWCVSGENVRKAFESRAFEKAVGGKYILAVSTDGEVRTTYRVDLRAHAPRARYVRVRRTPEAKNEFFHLFKILVYGRKLY